MEIMFRRNQSLLGRKLQQKIVRKFYISIEHKEIYEKILESTISLMNEANHKKRDERKKEEKQREEFEEKYTKEKLKKVKKVTKKKAK